MMFTAGGFVFKTFYSRNTTQGVCGMGSDFGGVGFFWFGFLFVLGVFVWLVVLLIFRYGFVISWFWWGFFPQKKPYIPNFCLGRIGIIRVILLALCYLLCYSQLPGWQHWLCYTERDQTRAANSTGMWYFSPLLLPVEWRNVIETAEDMRFVDGISDYFMENLARKAREGNTRVVLILRMPQTWLGTLWVKSSCVTATIIFWD